VILVCGAAAMTACALAQGTQEKEFLKRMSDAVSLYRGGKLDDARSEFEALHQINPRSSDVDAWLGFIYVRQNKARLAIPLLEQAEAQQPRDLEIQIDLGSAYMVNGDLDRALDKYHNVIHLNPNLFEPYYNCGTIYLRQRAYSKAVSAFIMSAKMKSSDPYVQNNLGVAYENLHDELNAAKAFRKAAEMMPDNLTFAHNAGLALAKLRSPDALPYLEKCLGDGTDPAVALALGESYSRAGRTADALKYYESLRTAEATNSTYWFNLGVLRAQNQDEAGAEQAYRKTLDLNPNDLDALNNLGLMLYRRKEYAEAETMFDKLGGLNPSSIAAKLNLGAAASQAGDYPTAIAAWREVAHSDPRNVGVQMDLAHALVRGGLLDEARGHYLQILSFDKYNAEALNGIGFCYLKAGKYVQAEAALRSAIDANPKLVAAYNNLAVTLQKTNQSVEAVKVLERAVKIAPTDDELRRNLARMRGEG